MSRSSAIYAPAVDKNSLMVMLLNFGQPKTLTLQNLPIVGYPVSVFVNLNLTAEPSIEFEQATVSRMSVSPDS